MRRRSGKQRSTGSSLLNLILPALIIMVVAAVAYAASGGAGAGAAEGEAASQAAGHATGHASPVGPVLISLIIIIMAGKLGGDLLERLRQPAVLGELVLGVVIGNLGLVGFHGLEYLKHDLVIEVLAEIGVIILLFEVGLESKLGDMMKVGPSSLLVAALGVIAPFFLGWGVGALFLPEIEGLPEGYETYVHIFIGATLTATSVGITARVLKDLGKIQAKESKIILGAAVIDDVMGLIILAVVSGIITAADTGGAGLSSLEILAIVGKAVAFLVGAIVIGSQLSPRLFRLASRLKVRGVLLSVALLFCFLLAYLADLIGLAPIVGAFAAGIILEEVHYRDFTDRGEHDIAELLMPISIFLVPVFFVRMGIKVDLLTFTDSSVLGFAACLTVVAIIGKQVCSLGAVERGLDRISVGVGMIPRGEVGLIFANIGSAMTLAGVPVIDTRTLSAVVIMVIVTTMVTPPVLKITLARGERRQASNP